VGSTNIGERLLSDPSPSSRPIAAAGRDELMSNGRRPRSGRRRHKGRKQRNSGSAAALTSEASSSSSIPPAELVRPGLPGHQKQLESALSALKQARQLAPAPVAAAVSQYQQVQGGHHHHSGMLAWQEQQPSSSHHQQHQLKQQQLSVLYGGPGGTSAQDRVSNVVPTAGD
jgi:hypothetical protein